jgi:translocation and assembly module TamB
LGRLRYQVPEAKEPLTDDRKQALSLSTLAFISEIAIREWSVESLSDETKDWSLQKIRGTARLFQAGDSSGWQQELRTSARFEVDAINGQVRLVTHGPLAYIVAILSIDTNVANAEAHLEIRELMTDPQFVLETDISAINPEPWLDRKAGRYALHLKTAGTKDQIDGNIELKSTGSRHNALFDKITLTFSADAVRLKVQDLSLYIDNKAVITGVFQALHAERFTESAAIRINGLNLRHFDQSLIPTELHGTITLEPTGQANLIQLNLQDRSLGKLHGSISIDHDSADLILLELDTGAGSASLSGYISFTEDHEFLLKARAENFDPGSFAGSVQGNLSFSMETSGRIHPLEMKGRLEFQPGSRLGSETLSGQLCFALSRDGSTHGTGKLTLGERDISLQASGHSVDIRFAGINPGFMAEGLNAELWGRVRFDMKEKHVALDISSPRIRYQDIEASKFSAQFLGHFTQPETMSVSVQLADLNFATKGIRLENLSVAGKPASHRIEAAILLDQARIDLVLSGSYDSARYHGKLESLRLVTGNTVEFMLDQPTEFSAGPSLLAMERLSLKETGAGNARVELAGTFDRHRLKLTTSGEIHSFPFQLPSSITDLPAITGLLSAKWALDYDDSSAPLRGILSTEILDLNIGGNDLPITLQRASLKLKADGNNARLRLDLAQNPGNRLSSRIVTNGVPGIGILLNDTFNPAKMQFEGQLEISLDDLSDLNLPGSAVEIQTGRLHSRLHFLGPLTQPRLQGTAQLEELEIGIQEFGFHGSIPRADVIFQDQRIHLSGLEFLTPASEGSALASGNLSLEPRSYGDFDLKISGSKLQLADSDTLKLTLTPELEISGTAEILALGGKVILDNIWITDFSLEPGVHLSSDVVVAKKPESGTTSLDPAGLRTLQLNLDVEIPDSLQIQWAGVNLLLGGKLNLQDGPGGIPLANGRLSVVNNKITKNTYQAYGQNLQVRKGTLQFASGPVNNPGLDILAIRTVIIGEVGIRVTGTVSAPEVQLQSDPAMNDLETLSWLVFGRPSSEAGKSYETLLLAAISHFSDGRSVMGQGRDWLGLDELSLDTDLGTTSGIVNLGKRINENLYLQYQQGILEEGYKIKATYQVTPSWSVIGESSDQSNAFEVEWTKRF